MGYESKLLKPLRKEEAKLQGIVFRRYRDGDEFSIVRLLSVIWPGVDKWRDTRFWRWRYKENPFGPPIVWLAEFKGEIIGHRAIVPVYMKIGGIEALVGLVADSGVHPGFRRIGVYRNLVSLAQKESAERGMKLTYGVYIPRHLKSYNRYERLGEVCSMTSLIKVIDWSQLLRKFSGKSLFLPSVPEHSNTENFNVFKVNRVDERFNILWKNVSPAFPIIVKRDVEYLRWRYFGLPTENYVLYAAEKSNKILGYCVLKERVIQPQVFSEDHSLLSRFLKEPINEGLIIDIFGCPNAVKVLLHKAEQHFKEKSVDVIHCRLSEKNPYLKIFTKLGYRTIPYTLHMIVSVAMNLQGKIMDEKKAFKEFLRLSRNPFFLKKQNWCLFFSDCDQV